MMKKIHFLVITLFLMSLVTSCTQVEITMPKGPKGDNGLSAYEIWKESVNNSTIQWPKDETSIVDFFRYLKGKEGEKGDKGDKGDQGDQGGKGNDGRSAYEIWKELISTGDVDDPHNPNKKWDKNKNSLQDFWHFLTGKKGDDGRIPYIGQNGNWWIGDVDTKVPARGDKGDKGDQGDSGKEGSTPYIGQNGNWWIGNVDTKVPARGDKGDKGDKGDQGDKGDKGDKGDQGDQGGKGNNGKSAYELWKEEIAKGKTPNPHNPSEMWEPNRNTLADFWEYLRGRDGKNTNELISDYILSFIIVQIKENEAGYDAKTGDAIIKVTDRDNKPIPTGSKVEFSTKFGFSAMKVYTVLDNSTIRIPRADLLPNGTPFEKRSARASIKLPSETKVFQTNIFTFPTQISKGKDVWNVWNDWGAGVIRAHAASEYIVDAAGSTAVVELNSKAKIFTYTQVSLSWFGAKTDDQQIKFEITDRMGTPLPTVNPKRIEDMWYARVENTPVARRTLYRFDANDQQKVGWEFKNSLGRDFDDNSYYVRTKAINHFFGVGGVLQSPVIQVPPMPRVPLIKSIKFENNMAMGTLEELDSRYKKAKVGDYKLSTDGVYEPIMEEFEAGFTVNLLFTKPSVSNVGSTTLGTRTFSIPAAESQLEGMKVWISSPAPFTAPSPGIEAALPNQQNQFRPVFLGEIVKVGSEYKIRVCTLLAGNSTTYIPLQN